MALSAGLGQLSPVREDPREERLPSQTVIELASIAKQVRDIADDIDPTKDKDEDDERDEDFDENLAEKIGDWELNKIAADLLKGIEADLLSRRDWEEMVERAIKFMGLIYEEASGEMSSEGSISKAWHTLVAEAAVTFWANAHAEFLPADGPVKIKDDQVEEIDPQAPPPNMPTRTQLAEAKEKDLNHYLKVKDKQYYRDFSRMLFSVGPKGTEFRKVYFNPLRGMPVSEWVKSENLIISNDEADISTAGRVTEKIPMSNADVRWMAWKKYWRDVTLRQPMDTPTGIQETIGRTEGIKPRPQLPEDQMHTIYECCCKLDLPGYEHEAIPLPYIVTIDKDSRQVLAIRRNWKQDDEEYHARQRYVMFGLVPGFGLYYLGFAHLLGNTERSLTALQREVIDNLMMSIFPGWLAKKGSFSRGDTQVRIGPSGVKEVDVGMQGSIRDAIMAVPTAPIPAAFVDLFQKLEDNGRKVVGQLELPVGEGLANVPVGTMIAMIEQTTKVMAAVHKGLHDSRQEELELLNDLIAEDPSVLEGKKTPSGVRWSELQEEFADIDLVPSSDPNVPSHIHRVMQFIGLGQLAQMFPEYANRARMYKEGLTVLQINNPAEFTNPNPVQGGGPDPKMMAAQLQAQTKMQDSQTRAQTAAMQTQGKLKEAQIDQQTELLKTRAEEVGAMSRQHDSAAEDRLSDAQDRAHDTAMAREQRGHETGLAQQQQAHDAAQAEQQHAQDRWQTVNQPPPAGRVF